MDIARKDLEAQARKIHAELSAAATAEIDRWLEATLEMLRRMPSLPGTQGTLSGEHNIPIREYKASGATDEVRQHGRTLSDATRQAIASIEGDEFDSTELRRLIAPLWGPMDDTTPRANLANLLRRMSGRGEIELIEQGKGPRPSRYRKKNLKTAEVSEAEA